jgi:hypothetical protein
MIQHPGGIAVDFHGNLYIAEYSNCRIRKVFTNGTITTVAGKGTPGSAGDGGPAVGAQLNYPGDVAVDGAGNIYIAETDGHKIRKVFANGTIVTIAGTGVAGYSGDSGPATSAMLYRPLAVTVEESTGDLFFADSGNNLTRWIDNITSTHTDTPVNTNCTVDAALQQNGVCNDGVWVINGTIVVNDTSVVISTGSQFAAV